MSEERVTVFVNERAVLVPRGATVSDAVDALDPELAGLVANRAAYVTDGTGRTVASSEPVREAGGVLRVVVTARAAAAPLSRETLRRWPKAELHVHLDGSLRPATLLELARGRHIPLPAETPDELARAISARHATSLEDYLTRYEVTLSVLQTAEALERVAYEFLLDGAAEHVRYVEVRYSPLLHRPALSLAAAIEAPLRGLERASRETGAKFGVIMCGIRTFAPATSVELVAAAADYRGAGVVGFDLAGAERGHPAERHREAFELAQRLGLSRTVHAGEGEGPGSIRQALDSCTAQRIGHGTRLGDDPELLHYIVEHRIPLEMCITSNVHTRAVPRAASHPLRRYLEQGVIVTINTDGRLIDGVTLTDEYYLAHSVLGLTREQLQRVVLNACEQAFLPEYERVALVARVQSEMERLE